MNSIAKRIFDEGFDQYMKLLTDAQPPTKFIPEPEVEEDSEVEDDVITNATAAPKEKRKSIPKNIKDQVWDHHIGKKKGNAKCFCCKKKEIRQSCFHAGHVVSVAEGGPTTVDNLRPICRSCNQSMGTMNMDVYIETYKPDAILKKQPKKITKAEKIKLYQKEKGPTEIYKEIFGECNPLSEPFFIFVRIGIGADIMDIPKCSCGMDHIQVEKDAEKNLGNTASREQRVNYIVEKHLKHWFKE